MNRKPQPRYYFYRSGEKVLGSSKSLIEILRAEAWAQGHEVSAIHTIGGSLRVRAEAFQAYLDQ